MTTTKYKALWVRIICGKCCRTTMLFASVWLISASWCENASPRRDLDSCSYHMTPHTGVWTTVRLFTMANSPFVGGISRGWAKAVKISRESRQMWQNICRFKKQRVTFTWMNWNRNWLPEGNIFSNVHCSWPTSHIIVRYIPRCFHNLTSFANVCQR